MKKSQLLYGLFALTLLISACAPSPQPTADAANVAQQIETSVAATIVMGQALTAAVIPTNTETPIPQPSATPIPTLTPFPTLTPYVPTIQTSTGGGGGTGGGGAYPTIDPRYQCQLVDQKPLAGTPGTVMKVGEKLDVVWTYKNVGTKTWESATFGFIFANEQVRTSIPANKSLTTNPMPFTIGIGSADVKPGEYVTLRIELTAPAAFEGRDPVYFTVQMAIVAHGTKFCYPTIQVEVIRPGMTP